jgi:hypothetical protein
MSAFKKTQDAALEFGKGLEEKAGKLADLFSVAKKGALGLVGAFAGFEVSGFLNSVLAMDATTGRLARSLGQSTENLSKWEGMVRAMGGSAGDAQRVFAGVTDAINQYMATTGLPPPALMSLLNRTGVGMSEFTRNPNAAWDRISDFLVAENTRQPGMGRFWGQQIPGMTESFLNTLLLGSKGMAELRKEIEGMGFATEQSAHDAMMFQMEATGLEVALENLGRETFPALIWLVNTLAKAVDRFSKETTGLGNAAEEAKKGNIGKALFGDFWDYIYQPGANWGGVWDILRGRQPEAGATAGATSAAGALPLKPGAGTMSAAMSAVEAAIAGVSGIKQITALADSYHAGFGSAHNAGRAMDVTVNDPSQSGEVAAAIEQALAAKGIRGRVINEYLHPSSRSTGGHLHIETSPVGRGTTFNDRWGAFGPGAGAAARSSINSTSNQHSSNVNVNIGTVTVQTAATDAGAMSRDVASQLRKNLAAAMNFNSSMTG